MIRLLQLELRVLLQQAAFECLQRQSAFVDLLAQFAVLQTQVSLLGKSTNSITISISFLSSKTARSRFCTKSSRYWYRSFLRARHSRADWRLRSNFALASTLGCFLALRPRLLELDASCCSLELPARWWMIRSNDEWWRDAYRARYCCLAFRFASRLASGYRVKVRLEVTIHAACFGVMSKQVKQDDSRDYGKQLTQ